MRAAAIIPSVVIVMLSSVAWLTDFITLKGERTVYSANCQGGAWRGNTCTGRLVAGDRFRFRALKAHKEVVFWTAGDAGPSGKLTDCEVQGARAWRCRPLTAPVNTITFEMVRGNPVRDPSSRVLEAHPISKFRWYLSHLGLPVGNDADG
jgi:hypothetical protein